MAGDHGAWAMKTHGLEGLAMWRGSGIRKRFAALVSIILTIVLCGLAAVILAGRQGEYVGIAVGAFCGVMLASYLTRK
jgi:hypothetical protein